MAHFKKCEACAERGFDRRLLVSDVENRIVCVADLAGALSCIREGANLGLIISTEVPKLLVQLDRMILPSRLDYRGGQGACGHPVTFVRGPMDAIAAICRLAPRHPIDEC
ncbi:MAG: hypothetical protein ABH846_02655 [Patescibacteria group bacterium]